jgi:hypothetical protein
LSRWVWGLGGGQGCQGEGAGGARTQTDGRALHAPRAQLLHRFLPHSTHPPTSTPTQAIADPADLCDLLFALKPASTLAPGGLYHGLERAAGLEAPAPPPAGNGEGGAGGGGGDDASAAAGKVAAACAAVRAAAEALQARGGGGGPGPAGARMLKVVVTSFARSDPPDLESALLAVKAAKEAALAAGEAPPVSGAPAAVVAGGSSDDEGDEEDAAGPAAANGAAAPNGAAPSLGAAADAALRHLLLHVDSDVAYRTALGLYDLGLAFMVVSHAQKDPGEYLDELSRFGVIQVRPVGFVGGVVVGMGWARGGGWWIPRTAHPWGGITKGGGAGTPAACALAPLVPARGPSRLRAPALKTTCARPRLNPPGPPPPAPRD